MAVSTPHFAVPLRVGRSVDVVEQDSVEEIEQCVTTILGTPVGSLIDEPELGRPDETFELLGPNPSASQILSAIDRWEPRAAVVGEARIEELAQKTVTVRSGLNDAG
jgi:phage baseplate assembly protein W